MHNSCFCCLLNGPSWDLCRLEINPCSGPCIITKGMMEAQNNKDSLN